MGLKKVYSTLKSVFPQVDRRVLRTIAIENSKDMDTACLAVLTEVLPFTVLRSTPSSPLSQSLYESQSSDEEGQNCHVEEESSNIEGSGSGSVLSGQNLENSMQAKIDTQSDGECVELDIKDGVATLQNKDIEADQNMNFDQKKVGLDDVVVSAVALHMLEKSLSNTSSIASTDDESSTLNALMLQSSQIPIMKALEKIIADAENNKKTLLSATDSLISFMKEVELREQAAEQAKLDVKTGVDLLASIEVIKQSLRQAKESHDMHAKKVYGEKAILAIELRELQARLLALAMERDASLSFLSEMRQTLEVRLATAENEIKFAEQEKLEKGMVLCKVIEGLELTKEKVAQEVNILKQQAEENAKLQEFLIDRGCVVDTLQGEIALICKDVKLLKERFDDNVLASKSLSSSQTSCSLDSSISSSENLNPEELASHGGVTEPEGDAFSRFAIESEGESSTGDYQKVAVDEGWMIEPERDVISEGKSSTGDYRKELVDDGWELFDDPEVFA